MKISLNWLRSLLPMQYTASEISAMLTDAGLEVESREKFSSLPGGLEGLVVGEVLTCEKHPDADRLKLTTVSVGNGSPLSIVCGAPNVEAGQKVIVATVGAKLFPTEGEPFEIRKSRIRGQVSEGMICAEDEIGLGRSHEGILVLPREIAAGTPAADYFSVEQDEILEIGLTPNRGDAASHYGVARDLAAILNYREHVHTHAPVIPGLHGLAEPAQKETIKVEVQDAGACPRYSGITISGIDVKESPAWLQNRLRAIGVRPINNIVDITNFVLHELGQPLHAFDLDKIKGRKVVVRRAKEKEAFVTLDGVNRELSASDLMICDEDEPMCIAGVFGGLSSGISAATKAIFLESAYFDPAAIRGTSRRHGLKTDASFRFERGADPEMTVTALLRAANLITEIAGGMVSSEITDVYPQKLAPFKVAFSYKNCSDLAGKDLDRHAVKNIILGLGMQIDSEGTDGLLLYVPRHKSDVTREADVIEEVLRIYGYDHVEPARHISYSIAPAVSQHAVHLENKVGNFLVSQGFSEIMGLSLTSVANNLDGTSPVAVLNPLSSDLAVLRTDLLHTGLQTIQYNQNRQSHDLKLFELGKVYSGESKTFTEKKVLALFTTGELFAENPHGLSAKADFAYLRGTLDALFRKCGLQKIALNDVSAESFAYGVSFNLGNKELGRAGMVNPALAKQFDLRAPVFYARIDWDTFARACSEVKVTFEEPSKFPSVRRDLALLVDKSVKYGEIEDLAYSTEKKVLAGVNLFDVYQDEKLGNKKSYAVSFTLLDRQATLTDKQIDAVMDKLISRFREKLGAELR